MQNSVALDVIEDTHLLESLINPIFNNDKLEDALKWEIVGLTKPKVDPKEDKYFVTFKCNTKTPLILILQAIISRVVHHSQEEKLTGFIPVIDYDEKRIFGFRPGSMPTPDTQCVFYTVDTDGKDDFMVIAPGFMNKENQVLLFRQDSVFMVDQARVIFWSESKEDASLLAELKTLVKKVLKKFIA